MRGRTLLQLDRKSSRIFAKCDRPCHFNLTRLLRFMPRPRKSFRLWSGDRFVRSVANHLRVSSTSSYQPGLLSRVLSRDGQGPWPTQVVGIDEGQFFDNELVRVANELAQRGVRVIIAGLDQDDTGKPWEPMPQLLSIAEYITKTQAICMKCWQPANYTQRTFDSEERVAVGGEGMYEARCRRCLSDLNREVTDIMTHPFQD
jgi:thymidine kinase